MKRTLFALAASLAVASSASAQLRLPAFTAYTDPDANGARVADLRHHWLEGPNLKVLWFRDIKLPRPSQPREEGWAVGGGRKTESREQKSKIGDQRARIRV